MQAIQKNDLPSQNPIEKLSDTLHSALSRAIGTTVHACLEYIARDNTWWSNHKEHVNNMLQRRGCTQSQLSIAKETVIRAITNTLACPKGQWILSAHDISHTEYSLTVKSKEGLKNIIIDRFFIDENCAWIIDYKVVFDHIPKTEQYYAQLNHYKKAIQKMYSIPIQLALYFPLQQEFHIVEPFMPAKNEM